MLENEKLNRRKNKRKIVKHDRKIVIGGGWDKKCFFPQNSFLGGKIAKHYCVWKGKKGIFVNTICFGKIILLYSL